MEADTSGKLRDVHSMSRRRFDFKAFGQGVGIAGFFVFSATAPHSIAAAEIGLGITAIGWLVRLVASRSAGLRRSRLDLPLALFFIWTLASAFLSEEPRISLSKMQSVCVLFVFYLARAVITRKTCVALVVIMIASACVGALWSAFDLVRGRGIVIESIAEDSPFAATPLRPGDAVWQVAGERVYSVNDIDDAIRRGALCTDLAVGVISQGEHAQWPGIHVTDVLKSRASPSGLFGTERTHRFRASGWTRHYESFAEILQMLTQLALGLALANIGGNRGCHWVGRLAIGAAALLAGGIVFTAMRSVIVALAVGSSIIAWRVSDRRLRFVVGAAILAALAFGSLAVLETRARHALELGDPSSSLRWSVAKNGFRRVILHPAFGHGMDAMHKHWTEWGFPGSDMLHMHSTPLQLAFDRGLPSLIFWFWFVALLWILNLRAERAARATSDFNRYGVLLGSTGAIAGFLASSVVNYNIGAGIVALVFWWLAGITINLAMETSELQTKEP